jgi:aryl-alcohol dehydrogenase-like predicted oxidoreductase
MPTATASGTFPIAGELEVNRLGFGAMRLSGPEITGLPADVENAKAVLRRAVELGVSHIDTADAYGPYVNEELVAEALYPYPEDLVIATKGGLVRTGASGDWPKDGRPEHLREACEGSLRRLKVDRIDVYYLHRPDPDVPYEESIGALKELKDEGKICHVAVSNVNMELLALARGIVDVALVQNQYSLTDRRAEDVLETCAAAGIGFVPWAPLDAGALDPAGAVAAIARRHEATPLQVAIAWLLHASPATLPIPGTSSIAHLEENIAAAEIELDAADLDALSSLAA